MAHPITSEDGKLIYLENTYKVTRPSVRNILTGSPFERTEASSVRCLARIFPWRSLVGVWVPLRACGCMATAVCVVLSQLFG